MIVVMTRKQHEWTINISLGVFVFVIQRLRNGTKAPVDENHWHFSGDLGHPKLHLLLDLAAALHALEVANTVVDLNCLRTSLHLWNDMYIYRITCITWIYIYIYIHYMWYIYIYTHIYIYYIILLYIHKHILDICVHVDHVGIWLLTTIQDRLGTFPDSRNNDGCLRGVLLIESLDRSMINLELAGRCCRVVQQRQRHVANVKSNSHMIQWYIMINQLKLTNFMSLLVGSHLLSDVCSWRKWSPRKASCCPTQWSRTKWAKNMCTVRHLRTRTAIS